MNVYETIISRRTIRKFKQEEIDPEMLRKLVNAGRLAPSAANLQPLEYLIIDDKNLKERIFPSLSWAGYIRPEGDPAESERPVAYIIIIADRKISPNPEIDIGASAENISLAAGEGNIGCCWIGAFKKKKVNKIIDLADSHSVELILALGYSMEKPVSEDIKKSSSIKYYKDDSGTMHIPKRRLEDILHFNKFEK